MTLLSTLLTFAMTLTVIGPGALATADPGVLENVAELRVRYGWGLEEYPTAPLLVAVEDCQLVGYRGVAWVEGLGPVRLRVVDCQQEKHTPLAELGLVADVNLREVCHEQAVLVIWDD